VRKRRESGQVGAFCCRCGKGEGIIWVDLDFSLWVTGISMVAAGARDFADPSKR